jgi:Mg-chelatase subunit ChlD
MNDERLRRWRLVLGADCGLGAIAPAGGTGGGMALGPDDLARDRILEALYGDGGGESGPRGAGLGASSPKVARWLGDVRTYFPSSLVRVMQQDAMERLGLQRMLLEPEMLDAVEPDIHLVGTLLTLARVIPARSRESARALVRAVVEELERRLAQPTRSAITGALNRAARTRRPRRLADVDWDRTIRANLRHYLPEYQTIIPATLIGHGRRSNQLERDVILCLDQSGSMAASVVYASVFAAVMASLRAVDTRVVAFDTNVVDLTEHLDDPVDVLFGVQLGGGTDINQALGYCQGLVRRPADTILVLISDLLEGGVRDEMLRRAAAITTSGVTMIALLALSDDGAPAYDHDNAAALAALGVPAFACTPNLFPELMAAAIERRDISTFLGEHDVVATRAAART